MVSLLLVFVCGYGDGAVFDGTEPARGRVVAVRGGSLSSRPDKGSDHVDFTPSFAIGCAGRENKKVDAGGCGNIRVAFQEPGKLAKSGNERLPLGCVGVGHTVSVSLRRMFSISVIPPWTRRICHVTPMQFQCRFSAT